MAYPVHEVPRGLLFWSVLYQAEHVHLDDLRRLIDNSLPRALVWHTDLKPGPRYYASEMGEVDGLMRLIAVSLHPVSREQLLVSKHQAFDLERLLARGHQRCVNIDPGLLCLEHVVLSTFKPYAHRLYLAQGVFLELCLQFVGTTYEALPWTYPDYADSQMIDFFHFVRSFLKTQKTCWKTLEPKRDES